MKNNQHQLKHHLNKYSSTFPTTSFLISNRITICYFSVLFIMIFATITSAFLASSPSASSTDQATSANASVNVSAVCKMTGTISSAHTATVMNDTYTENIGKTTLKSFCNDASGYSIYAVGFGNNTVGNTKLHSESIGTTYDIPTGINGSGSEWSMKVSSVPSSTASLTPSIDNNFNNYHIVPDRYTRVAYLGNSTDATTGSSVETTYAVRISGTQPAGTYEGKVKYILVHPNGDTPDEIPTMQDVANWKETLLENEEITVKDTRDNQTYTVAKLCVVKDSNGICNDGNNDTNDEWQIWMTQNLNFAPDPTITYTHNDTDLGWTTNNSAETWTPLASTMTNPAIISDYTPTGTVSAAVTGWVNDHDLPHWAEGTLNGTEVLSYNGTTYIGMQACINAGHTASQCEHYKIGNYYNWPAAIASNDASSITTNYEVAPNSICPAGWRLPKGLTEDDDTVIQSEFNALLSANGVAAGTDTASSGNTDVGYTTNGWTKINTTPLYFTRSGYISDITLYFEGSGRYWSNTAISRSNVYSLFFYLSKLYPANQNQRERGYSLRCLAR